MGKDYLPAISRSLVVMVVVNGGRPRQDLAPVRGSAAPRAFTAAWHRSTTLYKIYRMLLKHCKSKPDWKLLNIEKMHSFVRKLSIAIIHIAWFTLCLYFFWCHVSLLYFVVFINHYSFQRCWWILFYVLPTQFDGEYAILINLSFDEWSCWQK